LPYKVELAELPLADQFVSKKTKQRMFGESTLALK
jgi:hypothetical protein